MKNKISFLFLLFCMTSCEEEDFKTYYYDHKMEDVPSLWEVDCKKKVGTSLNNAISDNYLEADSCENDRLFIYFHENGQADVYRIHDEFIESNTTLSYKTLDNCHFDILHDENSQRWTLASESYKIGMNRYERPIIYSDSRIGEHHIYYKYNCREIRHDSLLYEWEPVLRGKLKVPESRIWSSKVLVGEFQGWFTETSQGMYIRFNKNGCFTMSPSQWDSGNEYNGKFAINNGAIDTLNLLFDNGEKQTYTIVIVAENAFLLYDEDGNCAEFYHRYWDF